MVGELPDVPAAPMRLAELPRAQPRHAREAAAGRIRSGDVDDVGSRDPPLGERVWGRGARTESRVQRGGEGAWLGGGAAQGGDPGGGVGSELEALRSQGPPGTPAHEARAL